MDVNLLVEVLRGCLSTVEQQRKAAEETLARGQHVPGTLVNLLQVAAADSLDMEVRQVAAITFKNLIRKGWTLQEHRSGSNEEKLISEEEKNAVREHIFNTLMRAPQIVRVQLQDSLKMVASEDYPEKWPSLLPLIVQNLSPHVERAQLYAGLATLRMLVRKYEFRDEEDRKPMTDIVNATFPPLLVIFQALLQSGGTSVELAELLKLVLKCFYSVIYLGATPLLLQEDFFVGWMSGLHTVVTSPVPPEGLPEDVESRSNNQWWKAKKWALHVVLRLAGRYGDPKTIKDTKVDRPFAEMWKTQCSFKFLDAILAMMANFSNGQYLSPRVVNLALRYLTKALEVQSTWIALRPHCQSLVVGCVFPLCCFSDEDQELWQDDPHEYIRKGYDVVEEMYNTKTAAINFICELCTKRTKGNLDTFMHHIIAIMNNYSAACTAGAVDVALARQMDGAFLAIGSLHDLLRRKSPYKQELENFLLNYVVKSFSSPYPFLRAKACWVAGSYSDVRFSAGFGRGPNFNMILQRVIELMKDPELPVRIDAVVGLRNLMEAYDETQLDMIKPILPQLLNDLFSILNEMPENEEMVFALETVVDKFGESIAPHALDVCRHLVNAFWRMQGELEADEEGDAAEDGAMAMYGCLRGLTSVLDCVSSMEAIFPELEHIIFPIMHRFCSSEGDEILEEVLELVAYFTYFSPQISPQLWSLLPRMVECFDEFAIDFMEHMEVPLQNYISRGTDVLLTNQDPNYLNLINHLVQGAIDNADIQESDAVLAARLLELIMQRCGGRIDHLIPTYIQMAMHRLMRVEPVPSALKEQLVLVVANALFYNSALALSALQQQGHLMWFFTLWFEMIFRTSKKSGKPAFFRREYHKKVNIMALSAVMAAPEPSLPLELQVGMGQLMAGVLKQVISLKEQEEEEVGEAEEDDAVSLEEDDDEEEEASEGEAEEAEDEEATAYLARLEKEALKMKKGKQPAEEESSSDDDSDYDDDEEELEAFAINDMDVFVSFAELLRDVQQSLPARFQAMTAAMDPDTHAALETIFQYADVRKQKLLAGEVQVSLTHPHVAAQV